MNANLRNDSFLLIFPILNFKANFFVAYHYYNYSLTHNNPKHTLTLLSTQVATPNLRTCNTFHWKLKLNLNCNANCTFNSNLTATLTLTTPQSFTATLSLTTTVSVTTTLTVISTLTATTLTLTLTIFKYLSHFNTSLELAM